MSSFHGYFPIIHAASGATPECHTYLKVYGGTGGGSEIINGLPINDGSLVDNGTVINNGTLEINP